MNPKEKKNKILLPRKLAELRESIEDSVSNNSTLKNGRETLPLSSPFVKGKIHSATNIHRGTEEPKIRKNSENESNRQLNSVVRTSEIKENLVPARICESVERHKTRCPECSDSAIDPVATESNGGENGNGPFCSSFHQDIPQIPRHMTFNLAEKVSGFTSRRYYMRKRKAVVLIQKESEIEDEEPTLKLSSDIEPNPETKNGRRQKSSEAEIKIAHSYCEWLTQHKLLTCSSCETGRNAESLVQNAQSAETKAQTSRTFKRFKCRQCGKSFGTKGNLTRHIAHVHRGLKPHSCSTCAKSFSLLSNLGVHERIVHQGRKDHVCSTCGRRFGTKGTLINHMQIHGNERQFPCTGCSKKFKHKISLKKHKTNAHPRKHIEDSDSN